MKQEFVTIAKVLKKYCEKCGDELVYDIDDRPKCYGCACKNPPITFKCISTYGKK